MNNRALILAIGLSLLVAGGGKLLTYAPASAATGAWLLSAGSGLGQLLSLWLLVRNGTILGTVYARIMLFLGGLLLLGVAFKILHWVGANPLLVIALVGIALTYSMRFFRKPEKGRLGVLKLLFVLVFSSSALLTFLHLAPREVAYVPPMLLWLTVLEFMAVESRKRPVAGR